MRYGKRNQQECWFLFFVFKLVWLPENHIYSDKKHIQNKENKEDNMRIGITEYGDAGVDFRWENKLKEIDGVILITKNLNDTFIKKVLSHMNEVPIVVHCTCTGWGHTRMEPNVPDYKQQLSQMKKLIESGFPASRMVLRIDPIFPTEKGIKRVHEMLNYYHSLGLPENEIRYRISIVDEYPHVRERYKKLGFTPMYGGSFYPSEEQRNLVGNALSEYPYQFDTCAEDILAYKFPATFRIKGCISTEDLQIMGIKYDGTFPENPQGRNGCHCLACKTELLIPRKKCPHNCLYCFWKD